MTSLVSGAWLSPRGTPAVVAAASVASVTTTATTMGRLFALIFPFSWASISPSSAAAVLSPLACLVLALLVLPAPARATSSAASGYSGSQRGESRSPAGAPCAYGAARDARRSRSFPRPRPPAVRRRTWEGQGRRARPLSGRKPIIRAAPPATCVRRRLRDAASAPRPLACRAPLWVILMSPISRGREGTPLLARGSRTSLHA